MRYYLNMTRKQLHAEAIKFIQAASDAMDQAYSILRTARTADSVETGCGPYRCTARSAVGVMDDLIKAAQETRCEDCDLLMADCQCQWSNEEIGNGNRKEAA